LCILSIGLIFEWCFLKHMCQRLGNNMLKELQDNPIFGTWFRFSPCNLVPNRSSSATKRDTTKEYVSPPTPCTSNLYMEPIGGQMEHICVSISKSGHGPLYLNLDRVLFHGQGERGWSQILMDIVISQIPLQHPNSAKL
jgi:hypothetical protein